LPPSASSLPETDFLLVQLPFYRQPGSNRDWVRVPDHWRVEILSSTPERDEVRKHIAELEHAGKLPDNFNYVFETLDAGDKKVELLSFLKTRGFTENAIVSRFSTVSAKRSSV